MDNEICHLKLEEIIPNDYQTREVLDESSLKELAKSIEQHGVIQPIIVRKKDDKYEIVDGLRRYKASLIAGLTKIPTMIRNYDDSESVRISLIDNLQRQDFSPIEEARIYKRILEKEGMTQEELANNIGKSQSAVANKMRLLNLPLEVQEALLKQEISERHARSLLTVKDAKMQIDLLKKVIEKRMTVRELDSEIKNMSNMFIPEEFSNNNGNQNNFNENYNNSVNIGQNGMFMSNDTNDGSLVNNRDNSATNFNNAGNMFIPQTDPFVMNNNMDNGNNFVPNDVSLNNFVDSTQNTFNDNLNNNFNQNNGGANPFLTSTNYTPPMSMQNENNNFNPFSSIRMNSNNQNDGKNPNPFFVGNNSTDQNNNTIINDDFSNNSQAFNIDDYKLPGVDYSDNASVTSEHYALANDDVSSSPVNNPNLYQYVEDNPNYESVDQPRVVESIDDVINILKSTIDGLKNGKLRIETEEIDYDDSYQITIRIDKKGDF